MAEGNQNSVPQAKEISGAGDLPFEFTQAVEDAAAEPDRAEPAEADASEGGQAEPQQQPEIEVADITTDQVLYSNDDLLIRTMIDDIDQQVSANGNYVERYMDKDGQAKEKVLSPKEAQDLRLKLLQQSEKLNDYAWSDRSYKEWSLKWIAAKIFHAIRYVFDPMYRSMTRDAKALEHRADLDAQYKAFVNRKAKLYENSPEKEPEREKQKTEPVQEQGKQKEEEKAAGENPFSLDGPLFTQPSPIPEQKEPEGMEKDEDLQPIYISKEQEAFEAKIRKRIERDHIERPEALLAQVSQYPRDIAMLSGPELTPEIAKAAFDSAIAFRRQKAEKEGEIFDKKAEWAQVKYLVGKFPPMAMALSLEEQKKVLLSAALRNPEALTYMQPEAGNDRGLAERMHTIMNEINEKHRMDGTEQVDFTDILFAPLASYSMNVPDSAATTFLDHLEEVGQELEKAAEIPMEPEVPVVPEIPVVPEAPAGPEWNNEPEPDWAPEPPQEDIPLMPDIPKGPPEPEYIPAWHELPAFELAADEARQTLLRDSGGFIYNPDSETLKEAVIRAHPELFKELPDEEKTTDIIVLAVSKDLSLMRHVPGEEYLPEYLPREELKAQILDKASRDAVRDAGEMEIMPSTLIRTGICKETAGDSLEVKAMKKELRGRGFALDEERLAGNSDREEH